MMTFLDRATRLRRHELNAADDVNAFDIVLESLRDLSSIYEKAYLDLDNLEEVFGAIEMAQLVGKLAGQTPEQIGLLRDAFIRMVVRTLQLSVVLHRDRNGKFHPPVSDRLATGIERARDKNLSVSVITFNYDLVMEAALHYVGLGYNYALPDDASPPSPRSIPLLKLHGSINWYFCEKCQAVFDARTYEHGLSSVGEGRARMSLAGPGAHRCSQLPTSPTPVIVPPSWDKSRYQNSLRDVWRRASAVLAAADEIFVIGYSLPEADSFFRYLFALGTQSRTRVHRLFVVNPDQAVRPKFERFIGQGLRPHLVFADNGLFEKSVDRICEMLCET
jgi:hypothetical protein